MHEPTTTSSGSKNQHKQVATFGCLTCPREPSRCGEMCDLEEIKWKRQQQRPLAVHETVVHSETKSGS